MAEWFMEGYINRLLDEHDPIVRQLRREATFYCVPNMCPGEIYLHFAASLSAMFL